MGKGWLGAPFKALAQNVKTQSAQAIEIKFQNGAHFKEGAIFDLLLTYFSNQGKVTKIPSANISLTYIHVFCSPYIDIFVLPILKKIRIYQVRVLFGTSPGVDYYSCHFGTINK